MPANALTATVVTTPATIVPGTQLSPAPYGDGVGTYQVGVHWSTGTSTVSFFGSDSSGNIGNGPLGLRITATVPDNVDPVVTIVGSSQVTIPVCAATAVVPYIVQVDDLCDQEAVNFAALTLTLNAGNAARVTIGAPTNPANSFESRQYNLTFSLPGTYVLFAEYTDAFGNVDEEFLTVVVLANPMKYMAPADIF